MFSTIAKQTTFAGVGVAAVVLATAKEFSDGLMIVVAAIASAIAVLSPAILALWVKIRAIKKDADSVWVSLIRRGYFEASMGGHITLIDDVWIVSDGARKHYIPITGELKHACAKLAKRLGRPPAADEMGMEIIKHDRLEQYMLSDVCPALKLHRYGCVVIASHIACGAPVPPADSA